jgi:hypothetical protein
MEPREKQATYSEEFKQSAVRLALEFRRAMIESGVWRT